MAKGKSSMTLALPPSNAVRAARARNMRRLNDSGSEANGAEPSYSSSPVNSTHKVAANHRSASQPEKTAQPEVILVDATPSSSSQPETARDYRKRGRPSKTDSRLSTNGLPLPSKIDTVPENPASQSASKHADSSKKPLPASGSSDSVFARFERPGGMTAIDLTAHTDATEATGTRFTDALLRSAPNSNAAPSQPVKMHSYSEFVKPSAPNTDNAYYRITPDVSVNQSRPVTVSYTPAVHMAQNVSATPYPGQIQSSNNVMHMSAAHQPTHVFSGDLRFDSAQQRAANPGFAPLTAHVAGPHVQQYPVPQPAAQISLAAEPVAVSSSHSPQAAPTAVLEATIQQQREVIDELKENFQQLSLLRSTEAEQIFAEYRRSAEQRIAAAESLIQALRHEKEQLLQAAASSGPADAERRSSGAFSDVSAVSKATPVALVALHEALSGLEIVPSAEDPEHIWHCTLAGRGGEITFDLTLVYEDPSDDTAGDDTREPSSASRRSSRAASLVGRPSLGHLRQQYIYTPTFAPSSQIASRLPAYLHEEIAFDSDQLQSFFWRSLNFLMSSK